MVRKVVSGSPLCVLRGAIVLCAFFAGLLAAAASSGQATNPCPRFQPGSDVTQAADLFSHDGVLEVHLNYDATVDPSVPGLDPQTPPVAPPLATGIREFCFATPDGQEEPTLHVWPGDRLIIHVKDKVPNSLVFEPDGTIDFNQPPGQINLSAFLNPLNAPCLAAITTPGSTNIDFHGLNIAPQCGKNDVLHTIINSGQTYTYNVKIPENTPPGLYWYHPQVHGTNDGTQQGGATGALIVEGIQNLQPAVAGLPVQTFVVRAQTPAGAPLPTIGTEIPSWDLTVNYVLVSSCQSTPLPCAPSQFVGNFEPGVLHMKPGEKQLWRVVDASTHVPLDLQVLYDGVLQPLQIVALDGVPVNSDDGTEEGRIFTRTDVTVPPAGRVEFIIRGPSASVQNAVFKTLQVLTGPTGDNHPERPLFTIETSDDAAEPPVTIPHVSDVPDSGQVAGLAGVKPNKTRNLYFSEVLADPNNPLGPTNFYLTEGACSSANSGATVTCTGPTPTLFSPNNPPALVTTQGAVEDWTIENTATEDHAFHIHNLHFLLLAVDGVPVPRDQQQYLDAVLLPFWDGVSPSFPSVTVRLDFRGADVGDVLYECTFLTHADNGMRAFIRVLPKPSNEQ